MTIPGEMQARESAVYEALDALAIPYDRVTHAPAHTIEDCREAEARLDVAVSKNLLLCNRQQSEFYLLVMPGDLPFQTKLLSAQIHSARLSFASGEHMERLLNTLPGALGVMSLLHDRDHAVRLLVEARVFDQPYIGCHPCVNTATIKLSTADLRENFLPHTGHTPTVVHL